MDYIPTAIELLISLGIYAVGGLILTIHDGWNEIKRNNQQSKEWTMPAQNLSPEDQMMPWITSKWISKPIYVATELGVADIVNKSGVV